MKKLLIIIFLLIFTSQVNAQQYEIDSLRLLLDSPKYEKEDTNRLRILIDLSYYLCFTNLDSVIEVSHEAIKIAKSTGEKNSHGKALSNEGYALSAKGKYHLAISRYLNAIVLFEELNDIGEIINTNISIGAAYLSLDSRTKALKYNQSAYNMAKEENSDFYTIISLINIGEINLDNDPDISIENYTEALNNIHKITDYRKSLLEQALYLALGNVYHQKKEYNKSLRFYNIALKKVNKDDIRSLAPIYNSIADVYIDIENYTEANNNLNFSLHYASKIGDNSSLKQTYEKLALIGEKTENFKNAYNNHLLFTAYKDSLFDKERNKEINDLEAKYQVEKKEEALKLQSAELAISYEKEEQQKLISYLIAGGLILVIIFAFFVFNRLQVTKKQKLVIEEQKEIVETAHQELEEKNQEIIDSIAYAKRIQSAILPSPSEMNNHLKKGFVLYKPKDIVAGDFYWLQHKGEKVLFAAADCTGHGVPGAMVSVVCNNALNRSVREHGLTDPGEILNKTREIVIQEFSKSDEEVKDGMDIALCSLEGNSLMYAGAHNPLWIIRNGEILETKANKQPIGQFDNMQPYTTHSISLQEEDSIYIFSDGFVDQFGGEKGKKFKAKAFKKLLLSIQDKTMENQKIIINETFDNWKGNLEQIDDVCVIGVRV